MIAALLASIAITVGAGDLTPQQSLMGIRVATATAIVVGQMTQAGREDVIA